MCGRYTLLKPVEVIEKRFGAQAEESLTPRYNAAPSQDLPVILSGEPGHIKMARWGLVPAWAKDASIGYKMINARSEEVHEKASYKGLVKAHRCLVLADGFYEWKAKGEPYRFTPDEGGLFAFAGLWTRWHNDLTSFTILTTAATPEMEGVHDRMPMILRRDQERLWLDPNADPVTVQDILHATPDVQLTVNPANPQVGNVKNDYPELVNSR